MSKITKEEIIEHMAIIENPRSVVIFTCDGEEHSIYYNCDNKDFACMLIEMFREMPNLTSIAEKAIQLFYTLEEEKENKGETK